MTLATHAVVGALTAQLFPAHPLVSFVVGFASHFLIDAIPHWDYHLASFRENRESALGNDMHISKKSILDFIKIGFDICLGIFLSFAIIGPVPLRGASVFWGAVGGILPDPLQFVYWKFRREPFLSLQRFHVWIHTKKKLKGRPLVGIPLQVALVAIVFLLVNTLRLFY